MSENIQLLVNAITSLKPDENIIGDYLYSIVIAFISAVMGGYIGYLGILAREKTELEKNKVDAISDLLLEAVECVHNLIAIKDNYWDKLTDNPIQRLACVPPILMEYSSFNPDFRRLLFIARGASKAIETGLIDDNKKTYLNISKIKLLFENYNSLMVMWKKRDELVLPIKEKIISESSKTASATLSSEKVFKIVGHGRLAQAVDLNEKVLKTTHELLRGFAKLIDELPEVSELFISSGVMKKHGCVIRCHLPKDAEKFLTEISVNEIILDNIISA